MAEKFVGDKPRVRKNYFPYDDQYCWQAARPGETYLVAGGLHFYTWREAMEYALRYWDFAGENKG